MGKQLNFNYTEGYIYKASTPTSKGTAIVEDTQYTLQSTDIVLLKFDMSTLNTAPSVGISRFKLVAKTNSNVFGEIGYLNTIFNANTTFNTIPTKTKIFNEIVQRNLGTLWFTHNGFKNAQHGIYLTGLTGTFTGFALHTIWEEYSTTPTLTGSNINRDNFTVTFKADLANNYKVTAIQNGTVIGTKTGFKVYGSTDNVVVTFLNNELSFNSLLNITFNVEATYQSYPTDIYKDGLAVIYNGSVSTLSSGGGGGITYDTPTITALEPSGVNQDKDTTINVSWVSTLQDSFRLEANGKVYTGTTSKSIVIPSGTFTKLETINMTLTIYKNLYGNTLIATKTASFLLVGKPNTPTLEQKQYYSDAQPVFNWTFTDEYVQYRCEVYKAIGNTLVFDSGDTVSSATSCQCTATLENNTQYTVKVKVKTQFGYWSDYASNTFTTQFVVANKPSINIYAGENSIIINSDTIYNEAFDSCEIYRKTDNTEWVRIAFNLDNNITYVDRFVGAETYYYKVTSVSTNNAKNDSDIASASISINNFNFANVEDIENGIELIGNPNISITQNRQVSTSLYSGCYAPIVESGIQNYKSGSASFTVRKATYDKLLSVIEGSKVLIYRDRRGEKFYCAINSNLSKKYANGDVYNINFSFVEVPFLEKDMHSGEGNLPIIFFDGKYQFDGTLTFNAELPI